MSENTENYVLKIIRGPGKGKSHRLTKDEISVGSGKDSDVQQEGQYMSELHAVFSRRSDGSWFITNRSQYGTFLNRARIDSNVLAPGDFVQFGSEILVQFALDESGKKKHSKNSGDSDSSKGKSAASFLGDRPGVAVGIGAYLLAMAALIGFFMLGDFTNSTPGLDLADVTAAVEQTKSILQAQEEVEPKYRSTTNTDSSALYYSIIGSAKLPGGTSERQQRIDQLVSEIDQRFFLAWELEKRLQLRQAIDEYEKIVNMAPDIRIPTTRLASKRVAFLRGELISG